MLEHWGDQGRTKSQDVCNILENLRLSKKTLRKEFIRRVSIKLMVFALNLDLLIIKLVTFEILENVHSISFNLHYKSVKQLLNDFILKTEFVFTCVFLELGEPSILSLAVVFPGIEDEVFKNWVLQTNSGDFLDLGLNHYLFAVIHLLIDINHATVACCLDEQLGVCNWGIAPTLDKEF